jgi:hypothetical protein
MKIMMLRSRLEQAPSKLSQSSDGALINQMMRRLRQVESTPSRWMIDKRPQQLKIRPHQMVSSPGSTSQGSDLTRKGS